MANVAIENVILGHSPVSDRIFAGTPSPLNNRTWRHKVDVTQHFLACVISRWGNQSEIIESDTDKWEVTVRNITNEPKKPWEYMPTKDAEELASEAMDALVRLFPPEQYGEEYDAETIQNNIEELKTLALKKEDFQKRVEPWLIECFGLSIAHDRTERNHRFLEEALELVQAFGCTKSEASQLIDYVFDRPIGEKSQEAGGVMVTLAALCLAGGLDMHQCGETELERIWQAIDKIREKQANKPRHSPLPGPSAPQLPM